MKGKITNNSNLPQVMVDVAENDTYTPIGDLGVTTLIDSPRIRVLKKHNEYTEDVLDLVWSIFGTAVHSIIERACEKHPDKYESEKQVSINVDGTIIGGTLDLYDKNTKKLQDFKVTTVWSVVYDDRKRHWSKQLNIYYYMLHKEGYDVDGISIIAILKDWSAAQANRGGDKYPNKQIVEIPIRQAPIERIEEYIRERVKLHKDQEAIYLEKGEPEMDICTEEDRWAKQTKYAVKKDGRKTAIRVLDSMKEADEWIAEKGDPGEKLYIEVRKGEDIRCTQYCPVKEHCSYYKKTYGKR